MIVDSPQAVAEFTPTHSIDRKICALGGTNLRQLRDGLGLCPPGIIETAERLRKPFWKVISKLLLEVSDHNILTSEVLWSKDILIALQENPLDKGARELVGRLSKLPGGGEGGRY